MSTFGRKALVWWNYDIKSRKEFVRFNHTPKDIQLSILEKWYPVGLEVCLYKPLSMPPTTSKTYTIDGYVDTLGGYRISVIYDSVSSTHHPMNVSPTDEYRKMINRDNKLKEILK